MKLSDIDHLFHRYTVLEHSERRLNEQNVLGSKSSKTSYRKPSWGRYGNHRKDGLELYKTLPPWLKYEVIEIGGGSKGICVSVRVPDK